MSKVRINDLARELEVKSREILDVLTAVGVTEKKTHSSSLEADEAERVRVHFQRGGRSAPSSTHKVESEPKPKIDWSRVSKPGDVLKAIQSRNEEVAAQRPCGGLCSDAGKASARGACGPSAGRRQARSAQDCAPATAGAPHSCGGPRDCCKAAGRSGCGSSATTQARSSGGQARNRI